MDSSLGIDKFADNFFAVLSSKILGNIFATCVLFIAASFFILFLLDISGLYGWGNIEIQIKNLKVLNTFKIT